LLRWRNILILPVLAALAVAAVPGSALAQPTTSTPAFNSLTTADNPDWMA
jgi:hypothetical protein